MAGPLAGLRIIEVAGLGAGPYCGMMLADMGAEVLRVERMPRRPRSCRIRWRAAVARWRWT